MRPRRIVLLDLWCCVPYYTGHLCRALREQDVDATLGSVNYYFDPGYFPRLGIPRDPGLVDLVSRLRLQRRLLRRLLRALEFGVNLAALGVRFCLAPPDVVHVQYLPFAELGWRFELLFLRLLRRRGIRIAYTVHNVLPHDTGTRHRSLYEALYRVPQIVICQGDEARHRIVSDFGVDPHKVRIVPHGPLFHDRPLPEPGEARARLGLSREDDVVLCQGFVKPYKGLEFLLEAWPRVTARHPRARLVLAGTGEAPYLDSLRRKVFALGIGPSVRLDFRFAPSEELPALFQAADVLVYPYRDITTSGALMTGINYAKAIVATNLPAFRESLRDGETALLVDYGDHEALAGALARLLGDPEERGRLGRALAGRRAEAPAASWNEIAARTAACYEELR